MENNHRNCISYFDRQAKGYQEKSLKFPWSLLRKYESQTVLESFQKIHEQDFLEYGCGTGFYTRLILSHGASHITAIDASSNMVHFLPNDKRLTKITSSADKLKLKRKFSNILSCGMLEFVDTPKEVINNFSLHAKPNATLVILVPIHSLMGNLYKIFHRLKGNNIRLYRRKTICLLLEKSGWHVLSKQNSGLFSCVIKAEFK